MARAEMASHDALSKRVGELERSLETSRKELADLRVRNVTLTSELQKATAATAAQATGSSTATSPPAAGAS